jgi:chromatin segregation and condensation protein Rec8/ScpA/Scc1 (kleisin family)
MSALQKALMIGHRKVMKRIQEERIHVEIPERKVDITALIKNVYENVMKFLQERETITFSELVPSKRKEEIIYTLIPLLHLDTQEKVDMQQPEAFNEIYITKPINHKLDSD